MADSDRGSPSADKRYECTGCGACCRWEGEVRLRDEEVDVIADFLDMSVEDFLETYTKVTLDRRGLTLVEKADGACIFLTEDNRCRINPVKPVQCIGFPNKWNFSGWEEHCAARLVVPSESHSNPSGK